VHDRVSSYFCNFQFLHTSVISFPIYLHMKCIISIAFSLEHSTHVTTCMDLNDFLCIDCYVQKIV
jgi:hypothetical protein